MEINVSSNNQSGGVTAGQIVGGGASPGPPKLQEKPSFVRGVLSGALSKLVAAGVLAALVALAAYLGLKP